MCGGGGGGGRGGRGEGLVARLVGGGVEVCGGGGGGGGCRGEELVARLVEADGGEAGRTRLMRLSI